MIDELRTIDGAGLVFAHGHLLRVLAVRWVGLQPEAGRLLALDPATISPRARGDAGDPRLERADLFLKRALQTPSPADPKASRT